MEQIMFKITLIAYAIILGGAGLLFLKESCKCTALPCKGICCMLSILCFGIGVVALKAAL
jgi:hypothetical protein